MPICKMRSIFLFLLSFIGLTFFVQNARAQETTAYKYDAKGRLVLVNHSGGPANGTTANYDYDTTDNRINFNTVPGSVTQPSFSISAATSNEGSPLSFIVTRYGDTSSPVTVNYATTNGTAIAGINYSASSGSIAFAAGVTSQAINVSTIDDYAKTTDITMLVTLSAPSSGATITRGQAAGTITNIDQGWSSMLTAGTWSYCYVSCNVYTGYDAGGWGAMDNTIFNGSSVISIYSNSGQVVLFLADGAALANSGWNTITIPGVGTLTRASASYSSDGSVAFWSWASANTVSTGTVTIQ